MKFTIEGLSQYKLVEWNLDSSDAIILRYIIDFYNTSNKIKKIVIEDQEFFWINYKKLKENLPILKIKTNDSLRKRFKKYEECGLMKHHCEKNRDGSFSCYRFTELYEELLTHPTQSRHGSDFKVGTNNYSINNTSFTKVKDKGFSKNPIDSKKRKTPKINNFTLRMIGIWNQCPNTGTKHKTNVPTKLILSIQKHLTALRSGTFNDHVDLSTDFKKRNYITNEYLNKKYTKKEISNIVKKSLLHYKEGYWPENKNKLPQSLDKLFYNSGKYSTKRLETGGTSFFLKAAVTNPRRLRKPKSNDEVNKLIDATRSKEPMTEEEFNKYMNLSLPDGIDLH
jgi:hypothetical protein